MLQVLHKSVPIRMPRGGGAVFRTDPIETLNTIERLSPRQPCAVTRNHKKLRRFYREEQLHIRQEGAPVLVWSLRDRQIPGAPPGATVP